MSEWDEEDRDNEADSNCEICHGVGGTYEDGGLEDDDENNTGIWVDCPYCT